MEEGFYEEDEMGDLNRLSDGKQIKEAVSKGSLYHHDGLGMSKCDDPYSIIQSTNNHNDELEKTI